MKLRIITVLLLLVLVVAMVGACKPPATTPPTTSKGEITVGFLEGLTGPLAGTAIPYVDGELDAIRYINEKGGIDGHPLKATVIDGKMDSTATIAGWDRLRDQNVPFITGQTMALPFMYEVPNRDRIPFISGGGPGLDVVFPKGPSYFFVVTPVLFQLLDPWVASIEKD